MDTRDIERIRQLGLVVDKGLKWKDMYEAAITERDALRAKVERLTGEISKRDETFQKTCDGIYQGSEDRWKARAEAAEAHAERLRAALEWINRKGGCGLDVHDRINAALAATSAQLLAKVKAAALRWVAEQCVYHPGLGYPLIGKESLINKAEDFDSALESKQSWVADL